MPSEEYNPCDPSLYEEESPVYEDESMCVSEQLSEPSVSELSFGDDEEPPAMEEDAMDEGLGEEFKVAKGAAIAASKVDAQQQYHYSAALPDGEETLGSSKKPEPRNAETGMQNHCYFTNPARFGIICADEVTPQGRRLDLRVMQKIADDISEAQIRNLVKSRKRMGKALRHVADVTPMRNDPERNRPAAPRHIPTRNAPYKTNYYMQKRSRAPARQVHVCYNEAGRSSH